MSFHCAVGLLVRFPGLLEHLHPHIKHSSPVPAQKCLQQLELQEMLRGSDVPCVYITLYKCIFHSMRFDCDQSDQSSELMCGLVCKIVLELLRWIRCTASHCICPVTIPSGCFL